MKTKTFLRQILCMLFFLPLIGISQTEQAKSYYKKIAFGSEFSNSKSGERKWLNDVNIYVMGSPETELKHELDRVVQELNDLIDPVTISVVTDRQESNVIVLFGSKQEFKALAPSVAPYIEYNEGMFSISHSQNKIHSGAMYVNMEGNLTMNEKKHLLREELTQILGLCNDSYQFENSIFYQGWTDTTEYAEIDKELITMLYNN